METLAYLKNKYNLDFSQVSPIEIPNIGRLDFVRWVRELDFTRGAEIGVDHANFSHVLCDQNTQLTLYGIDPWKKYPEYREYESQEQMDGIFERAKERMANEIKDGKYIIIRKPSMEALADIPDESLDFVYIDANHEAPFVLQDIEGWAKKVRKGGIVAGHDYVRVRFLDFAIKDALKEYTAKNKIAPWFVLGRYQKRRGEVRDRSRSWAFVK